MSKLFTPGISSYWRATWLITILTVFTPILTIAEIQAKDMFGRKLDRQRTGRKVAQEWLMVGKTQYKKGFYSAAEKSLIMAKEYQKYLNENETKILDEMLRQVHATVIDQKRISQNIETVKILIEEKRLYDAKVQLQKINAEKNISKKQTKITERLLEKINQDIHSVESQKIFQNVEKS